MRVVVDLGPATGHDQDGEPPADPWLVVGVRGGEVFHLLRRYTEAQAREIAMAFRGVFGMPWHAARESDARRACDVPSGVIR